MGEFGGGGGRGRPASKNLSECFTHLNEENTFADTAKTKDFKSMGHGRGPQNVQIMQPFKIGLQNLCVSSHASNQVRLGISLGSVQIESFYGRNL
jgi:hypothetical protein